MEGKPRNRFAVFSKLTSSEVTSSIVLALLTVISEGFFWKTQLIEIQLKCPSYSKAHTADLPARFVLHLTSKMRVSSTCSSPFLPHVPGHVHLIRTRLDGKKTQSHCWPTHAQTMQAPPLQWTGSGPARPWTFCSGALLVHKELP